MLLTFIQEQVFSLLFLQDLINLVLTYFGLDLNTALGKSLEFFIYDVLKISIYLIVLIFLISFIQSYFPAQRSKKIMERFKGVKALTMAALLGTVTPFCSCSSIPLFIAFTSAKIPLGVTFAFLISSPMVDLASCVLLMSIFGFKIAILYILLGLVIAVIGGYIIEKMQLSEYLEDVVKNSTTSDLLLPTQALKQRFIYAKNQAQATFKKVFPYILVGVGIGACIHNYIPKEYVENILGQDNPLSVILATVVGIPIYADIFGTIPIAQALLYKGANLGTVLAFMMAVTTLSLPSLIMLRKAIKPKLLAIFTAICTVSIIAVGFIFNVIEPLLS